MGTTLSRRRDDPSGPRPPGAAFFMESQMQIDGALVREQGITFAVVAVKKHVVDNRAQALSAARSFAPLFQNVPIVLMGQDSTGRATFFGRQDIVRFLSRISLNRLPWKRYTV